MITEDEFRELLDSHYTGDGPFNGYRFLGYVGNADRNYLTDEWVLAGANQLYWTLGMLDEWVCSRWGRWALDTEPRTAREMLERMGDVDKWLRRDVTVEEMA